MSRTRRRWSPTQTFPSSPIVSTVATGTATLMLLLMLMLLMVAVVSCGSSADPATERGSTSTTPPAEQDAAAQEDTELFPDVIDATAQLAADGTWTISATLSSPYDTPDRYADGWRVVGPDGEVYGTRPLAHDHQSEQPFTRNQSGIAIPEEVSTVTIEGRDQLSGWGGATVEITLQR